MLGAAEYRSVKVTFLGGLAVALMGGASTAAVEPGPASLPGEVVGVIGSGDKLSLKIKAGEETRVLNIGDVYQDGWALTSLTGATATLARDGQTRLIGLNPSGAVAAASSDVPAAVVDVLQEAGRAEVCALGAKAKADFPAFQQLVSDQLGPWDGKTPRMGLSLEETRRFVAYQARGGLRQAASGDGSLSQIPDGFLAVSQIEALGADTADYLALNQKLIDALNASRGVSGTIGTKTYAQSPGQPGPPAEPPETRLMMNQLTLEAGMKVVQFSYPQPP